MPNDDSAQKNDPVTPGTPGDAPPPLSSPFPDTSVNSPTPEIVEQVPDPTAPIPTEDQKTEEQSFTPPMITPPAPARSKAKIVGALLAVLILVVSIPAGIFLVQQSQEFREKASCPDICDGPPACRPGDTICDGDPACRPDPDGGEDICDGPPDCHQGPDICDGPPACHPDPECSGITECEDYIESCPSGGARTCYKSEVDGVCINTHCDACPDPPTRQNCTYNEVCTDAEGGGIKECNGTQLPGEACEYDDAIGPSCSACNGAASFSGSCSVSDTGNGSFSYSCQINCTGSAANCNSTFNLDSSWFHCKTQGGAACGEFSGSDLESSGTPSLSNPTITSQVGSSSVSGTGSYSAQSCGRTQFDVAINNVTDEAGAVRDMGSNCSATCSSAGFWCANNAAGCTAPHVIKPGFSCDMPGQVCCELKDTGTNPTAQCTNIKVYDANNNKLDANQLKQIKAGDNIKIAINGSSSSGTLDKARFRINGGDWLVTTTKNTTGEYFINYPVPAGTTNFQMEGMIHHQSLNDWF